MSSAAPNGKASPSAETRARASLRSAFDAWGESDAAANVRLEFSTRMTSSLGRCYPDRQLIRLHEDLRDRDAQQVLHEVICHEAAHIVAFERHGRGIRPHGPEWADLVRAAGVPARTRIPCEVELDAGTNGRARSQATYEHRCPVCQTVRYAKRPVRRWRCAACVEAGLSGELQIVSRPSDSPQDRAGAER